MNLPGPVAAIASNRTAFVGREAELALVSACVDSAVVGRAQVVWVVGEAGSGKTGFLRAALERLPSTFRVLAAEADELATDTALGVVRQLGPLQSSDGFGAGLELLEVLGTAQGDSPLAVIVEDLHWADLASGQALLTVARRLRDDQVILLVSTRPGAGIDGWERFASDSDRCVSIAMGALSPVEVAHLSRETGIFLDRRSADRLHRHTQGHVLYVKTLLAELTSAQLTSADGDLPAPQSLSSTTIARMADLPRDAQLLGSALAVVNQRVALRVVGQIAGLADPAPALEALLTTGFVKWWPGEITTPVELVHPLYRKAIYDDLSPTLRQKLHRAAAAGLGANDALIHRVAAADPGDEGLTDDLVDAAGRAEARLALGLAARNWLWVASLATDAARGEHGLLEAARLLLLDGQTVRALGLHEQIERASSSPLRSLLLGMLDWEAGNASSAESWFVDAARLAALSEGKGELEASALARLAFLYVLQDRGAEALVAARAALALRPTDTGVEARAWDALVRAECRLRGAAAGLSLLAARMDPGKSDRSAAEIDLLVTRGTVRFYAGQNREGASDLQTAVRSVHRGGVIAQLPRAHIQLAQLLIILGDWDDALVNARLGLSLVEDQGQVWIEAQAHAALASVLGSRGHWPEAAMHVDAALQWAATSGTDEARFTSRIAESAVARARDDPARVITALSPLAGTGESRSLPMFTSLGWWPPLVHALAEVGDVDVAARHVHQLEAAGFDRGLDLRARIEGLKAVVELAQGDPDRAAASFSRAITMLGPDDPLLDRAALHHDYGRLLRARGDRVAAIEQLRLAHDLLTRPRAEPYQQRVQRDLEACGLRATLVADRSPLALTDREQDVAALVANGLTNRQVAADLYISSKAVEYHLRNIFAKLGISSRRELRVDLPA